MQLLKDKIKNEGVITEDNILMVDGFLNHKIDTNFINQLADEFIAQFDTTNINKILTIETSGIVIAYAVASKLGVPFVFAKKSLNVNITNDLYSTKIVSHTHFREFDVLVSKKCIDPCDNVLIIDDFLANGSALQGLLNICKQAKCNVNGIGIVIEKTFLAGSELIREQGYDVKSLVKIEEINYAKNLIKFA